MTDKAPTTDPPAKGVALEGLLGEWMDVLHTDSTRFFEHWERTDDDFYKGIGFVMAGADTVFIEQLMIGEQGSDIVYSARIQSQNEGTWIPFTMQGSGSDTLRFTNPAHDFPQEIRYTRSGNGWNVRVSGSTPKGLREERFELVPSLRD